MKIENFVQCFSEQFEETPKECLNAQTIFKDLDEWSSLMALSIISMIDEEYDVTIGGSDIRNATTIEDLYKVVESKI